MILREVKNIFIKNRLTEGVDFKRYEWLKGDGRAYITGIKYNLWTNRVEMKIGKINVTTSKNNEIVYLTSPGNNCWAVQQNPTSTPQLLCIFRESGLGVHILDVNSMPSQVTLSFYQNGGYASCLYNGTEYRQGALKQSSWDTDIIPIIYSYKMSYIREVLPDGSYNSNLIPCKLLRSIPSKYDANGISRPAGSCGMYDSISGKFYGNVASTGTFTVEGDVTPETHTGLQQIYQNRLIEGVDYYTYDWLKGDGRAYIDTKVTDLSISDYIKTIFDDSGNIGVRERTWGREGDRLIVGNDKSSTAITVWGASSYFRHSNGGVYLYDMYFDLLNNKVAVNNQIHSLELSHGNGVSFLLFARHSSQYGVDFKNLAKYKSFEIHNQINLVPCQLLKTIPRNLDAQCKERVAGECGMIDLISGKFYGNVASSGSFSVEDDN